MKNQIFLPALLVLALSTLFLGCKKEEENFACTAREVVFADTTTWHHQVDIYKTSGDATPMLKNWSFFTWKTALNDRALTMNIPANPANPGGANTWAATWLRQEDGPWPVQPFQTGPVWNFLDECSGTHQYFRLVPADDFWGSNYAPAIFPGTGNEQDTVLVVLRIQ